MDIRNYNRLDKYLHKVSSHLSLKEDDMKVVNEKLAEIVEKNLIPIMRKEDEYFNKMFRKINYSGSYYEKLRICEANEFDLNLELKSESRNEQFFQISCDCSPPGFVQVQRKSGDINGKWIDENGYVLQNKVFSWIQSLIDKALCKMKTGSWNKITRKTSGPAITLYVEYENEKIFSVDLVPVFVFGKSQWPQLPVRQPVVCKGHALDWCVVPKPCSFDELNENSKTFWRMSFYNQEKEILNNTYHLKNVLKIIKLLRNVERWDRLASYYIKTLSLWEENKDDHGRTGIGVLFIYMLGLLKHYLKNRQAIPFFWDERHNLVSLVHKAELEKISFRIERIINDINRNIDDPDWIEDFFDSHFRIGNTVPTIQRLEVSNFDEQDGRIERPLALQQLSQRSSWFQDPPENRDVHSLTTLQTNQTDWIDVAAGVGLLAIGGTLLWRAYNNNNRNQ